MFKKLSFSMLPLLVLFMLVETGLWMIGLEPAAERSDPYVGFAAEIPLYVEERVEAEGNEQRWMRTASNKREFFNDQSFPRQKREGSRRVFCMGGSTTYGRPYRDVTSFCGWLRASLEELDPSTRWDVINAGGISYASYRVAALMEELAKFEPDLFIVYTGHNEFLEERTYGSMRDEAAWLRQIKLTLGKTRSWTAMESLLAGVATSTTPTASTHGSSGRDELSAEVKTKLESSVGLDAYHRDDALTSAVLEHFEHNLNRMAAIARAAGAEILYVVPADNLRDCTPFKSELSRSISGDQAVDFDFLLRDAQDALYRKDFVLAHDLFSRAVEIDPRYAHARYGLGRALEKLGESEKARNQLIAARDEDVCPLRAISAIPRIVRDVATQQEAITVDFPRILSAATSSKSNATFIPGETWFLDHVHPTVSGHRLLARTLTMKIHELGWIAADPSTARGALDSMEEDLLAELDPKEHGLALRNLAKVLSWAGKNEDAARAARGALAALGDDEESFFVLSEYSSSRNDPESAVAYLREAIRLDPLWVKARNNLGVQLMRLGRMTEALEAYDEVIRLSPNHVSSHFNRANALKRLGRLEESIDAYETCLRLDPDDLDALYNIAGVLEEDGEPGRALGYLARLLELDPEDEDARRRASRLSSKKRSPDDSMERNS